MPRRYTLTEYQRINRENTKVHEYGADEKVRQAYTYGEEKWNRRTGKR